MKELLLPNTFPEKVWVVCQRTNLRVRFMDFMTGFFFLCKGLCTSFRWQKVAGRLPKQIQCT